MSYKVFLFVICFTCFSITQTIYCDYYNEYNLVFGKSDVDNYNNMWVNIKNNENLDYVHLFFNFFIIVMSKLFMIDENLFLTFFIPFTLWVITPLVIYNFYSKILCSKRKIFIATFCFLFGSFFIFFGGIISVYCQYFSMLFFIVSLENKNIIYKIYAVLIHPYTLLVYLVMYIIQSKNRFYKTLISFFLFVCIVFFYPRNILGYTLWSSHYYEPLFFNVIYTFINPLLFPFYLFGITIYSKFFKVMNKKYFNVSIILLCLGLVSHISRGLIYSLPFFMLYVSLGFNYLLDFYGKRMRLLIVSLFIVFVLIHFHYSFYLFCKYMIVEMDKDYILYGRNMPTRALIGIISPYF